MEEDAKGIWALNTPFLELWNQGFIKVGEAFGDYGVQLFPSTAKAVTDPGPGYCK